MIVCGTKDVVPFVKGFFENATSLCPKQLVHGAGHAAEETRKHAHEILRSQPTADIDKIFKKKLNKSSHNTRNQSSRDFIKKCKCWDNSHLQGKCPAYGKIFHVYNKKNHFKVCCPRVGKKKYMKLKRTNPVNPPNRAIMNFFLKLLIFRILPKLTKSRMKTLIGQ